MKPHLRTLAAMFILLATTAQAGVPGIIAYQGRLVADDGKPRTGPVDLTVRFYDAATGGNELWAETHPGVSLSNGVFSIQIGSVDPPTNPIPQTVFAQSDLWLGLTVGADAELSPRTRIAMVPFAAKASGAEGLVKPGTFERAVFVGIGGNIGIGTANPLAKLHVAGAVLATGYNVSGGDLNVFANANGFTVKYLSKIYSVFIGCGCIV